jgi:metal-responsive CopG/Arc/MetJ family transcriptional regulator
MDRKTKINVLLPMKMVGELENLSKLGKRSDFIMKAIRNQLDHRDGFDVSSISTNQLMGLIINRHEHDTLEYKLLLIIREMIL